MKLRDKETGAIFDDCGFQIRNKWGAGTSPHPRTLKELVERFEDVEEPKRGWYIDLSCNYILIYEDICLSEEVSEKLKQIGNYFETKEEAEKAVEKLKAWKRLKDKSFRFDGYDVANRGGDNVICGQIYFKAGNYDREEIEDDLDLLFGGEK